MPRDEPDPVPLSADQLSALWELDVASTAADPVLSAELRDGRLRPTTPRPARLAAALALGNLLVIVVALVIGPGAGLLVVATGVGVGVASTVWWCGRRRR